MKLKSVILDFIISFRRKIAFKWSWITKIF
jgi:hypothetical protein